MSLCTNIPEEEGINIKNEPAIPIRLLQRALKLILAENSFQFNGKNYVQIHGTTTGTKMAVAFANIFMAKVTREEITQFIEQANKQHQTIKFTAEVSKTETNFLDTTVYKGEGFRNELVLDVHTHFKPTETFQYTELTLLKHSLKRASQTSKHIFLRLRGCPENFIQTTLSEVTFEDRNQALR